MWGSEGDLTGNRQDDAPSDRYGFAGWLDRRSSYGQDAFPEPFLVDGTGLETNEARLDWFHGTSPQERSDGYKVEVEAGFGLLTMEAEFTYTRAASRANGGVARGLDNVDLSARYPFFQFVAPDRHVDLTVGAAVEVGIPTWSAMSRNTEWVPKLFADVKWGDHFTLQTLVGYSALFGGGDEGGTRTLEYGSVAAYSWSRRELGWTAVQQLTIVSELIGETGLNGDLSRQSTLIADFGFRLNLKSWGRVQPRIGVAYAFPVNRLGRADLTNGVVTSFVFEY